MNLPTWIESVSPVGQRLIREALASGDAARYARVLRAEEPVNGHDGPLSYWETVKRGPLPYGVALPAPAVKRSRKR